MKQNRSAPKRFLFCMKELKRRSGKIRLCLVWAPDLQDWKIYKLDQVQIMGYQQEDIVYRNDQKLCDSCGEKFTGNHFPITNENFKIERGLIQCEKCYSSSIS